MEFLLDWTKIIFLDYMFFLLKNFFDMSLCELEYLGYRIMIKYSNLEISGPEKGRLVLGPLKPTVKAFHIVEFWNSNINAKSLDSMLHWEQGFM